MISISFRSNTAGLDELSEGNFVDGALSDVADFVVEYIKSHWTGSSPSNPGEPPAVVTGTLDASVSAETTGRSASGKFASSKHVRSRVVQITAPYAARLELGTARMAPRPFVAPAIAAAAPEMKKHIAARIKIRRG